MDPLQDDELNRALERWEVAEPPDGLEARTLAACREIREHPRGWKRWLGTQVRLPLPVVVAMALAIVALTVMLARVRQPAPGPVQAPVAGPTWGGSLQPVAELKLRVIRGDHANH